MFKLGKTSIKRVLANLFALKKVKQVPQLAPNQKRLHQLIPHHKKQVHRKQVKRGLQREQRRGLFKPLVHYAAKLELVVKRAQPQFVVFRKHKVPKLVPKLKRLTLQPIPNACPLRHENPLNQIGRKPLNKRTPLQRLRLIPKRLTKSLLHL